MTFADFGSEENIFSSFNSIPPIRISFGVLFTSVSSVPRTGVVPSRKTSIGHPLARISEVKNRVNGISSYEVGQSVYRGGGGPLGIEGEGDDAADGGVGVATAPDAGLVFSGGAEEGGGGLEAGSAVVAEAPAEGEGVAAAEGWGAANGIAAPAGGTRGGLDGEGVEAGGAALGVVGAATLAEEGGGTGEEVLAEEAAGGAQPLPGNG